MSEKTAAYLEAARALLQMNAKSVARALRMSDRTLSQMERFAGKTHPKLPEIIELYRDLGLKVDVSEDRKGAIEIVGIALQDDVRRVVLTADQSDSRPGETITRLQKKMRHVGGMVYNLKILDRGKAAAHDTIEAHFPLPTRNMVRDILIDWLETETPIKLVRTGSQGEPVPEELTRQKLDAVLPPWDSHRSD